jgi:hypothetical protein
MISGAVTGTRAVGLGRARTIPEAISQPCAMRRLLRDRHMNFIGWATILSTVHDGWTFAAFVLLLLTLRLRR